MKRLRTGGALNILNERYGCNSRSRTVPIMALLDAHPTDDPATLRCTIEAHTHGACACGVRSTGPVEKFALALFEAQFNESWREAGHRRYTFAECLEFQTELFCAAPIRGRLFEYRSRAAMLALLEKEAGAWTTRRPTPHEDGTLGMDYVARRDGVDAFGVQVKPHTVLQRVYVMEMNRKKHALCPVPVVFHVYDSEGAFAPVDLASVLPPACLGNERATKTEPCDSSTKL